MGGDEGNVSDRDVSDGSLIGDLHLQPTEQPEPTDDTLPSIPDSETPDKLPSPTSASEPPPQQPDVMISNLGPIPSKQVLDLMKFETQMVLNALKRTLGSTKTTESRNTLSQRKAAGLFVSFGHYIHQIRTNNTADVFTDEELFEIQARAKRCKELLDHVYLVDPNPPGSK